MTAMKIVKNPRTDVDVQLLSDVFPDLLPDGREITHGQIEAILKMPRSASRYQTVVRRWRRQIFQERRVYLDGMLAQGRGLIALTPDEMVRFANRRVRAAGRQVKKGLVVAGAPSDVQLSEQMRRYRSLMSVALAKIVSTQRAALRDLGKALAPQKQLPRASGQ